MVIKKRPRTKDVNCPPGHAIFRQWANVLCLWLGKENRAQGSPLKDIKIIIRVLQMVHGMPTSFFSQRVGLSPAPQDSKAKVSLSWHVLKKRLTSCHGLSDHGGLVFDDNLKCELIDFLAVDQFFTWPEKTPASFFFVPESNETYPITSYPWGL